jgi:hypothetical protein
MIQQAEGLKHNPKPHADCRCGPASQMVFRAETGAVGVASHGYSHATSPEGAGDAAMEKLSRADQWVVRL